MRPIIEITIKTTTVTRIEIGNVTNAKKISVRVKISQVEMRFLQRIKWVRPLQPMLLATMFKSKLLKIVKVKILAKRSKMRRVNKEHQISNRLVTRVDQLQIKFKNLQTNQKILESSSFLWIVKRITKINQLLISFLKILEGISI